MKPKFIEPSPVFNTFLKSWEMIIEESKNPALATERAMKHFQGKRGIMSIDVQKNDIACEVMAGVNIGN